MIRSPSGFTLIETAVALVVIGLMLGAVLKGQELVAGARVGKVAGQLDGVRVAYFAFVDRYRALPGDYGAAKKNIPNCGACENGDNNGRIQTNGPTILEYVSVWTHLSKAGFIAGNYSYAAGDPISAANTPTNLYGSPIQLIYDNSYSGETGTPRHNLKTGSHLPSNLLAELDRKLDDGRVLSGNFRYSTFNSAAPIASCALAGSDIWNATAPEANCGGVSLL